MTKVCCRSICTVAIISKVLYNLDFDRSLAQVGALQGW